MCVYCNHSTVCWTGKGQSLSGEGCSLWTKMNLTCSNTQHKRARSHLLPPPQKKGRTVCNLSNMNTRLGFGETATSVATETILAEQRRGMEAVCFILSRQQNKWVKQPTSHAFLTLSERPWPQPLKHWGGGGRRIQKDLPRILKYSRLVSLNFYANLLQWRHFLNVSVGVELEECN